MLVSAYRPTCPIGTHFYRGEICTRCVDGGEYWAALRNCRENLPESIAVAMHNMVIRKRRLFADHVTRFIMPSEFSANWIVEKGGISREKISLLYPIVDMPDEPTDPAHGSYVAYAGRFSPEKGAELLIRAAAKARLPLAMSGDSATAHNHHDHVEHVPAETAEKLADFYRRARIVVMPSAWNEVFGMVAAEAMSHGVPVIGARVGGLSELVIDGQTGLLFEPGNVEDLADKMTTLWNDPQRCRELGRNGRERVKLLCDRGSYFRKLLAIYEDAIAALGNGHASNAA
jgi:glycosyltransferase involved in cell wall biosynthesis